MTRQELINRIAELDDLESKAAATRVLDIIIEVITETVANGESITLGQSFGTFKPKTQAAKTGKVPGTGKPYSVPERKTITFKPSKALKRRLQ